MTLTSSVLSPDEEATGLAHDEPPRNGAPKNGHAPKPSPAKAPQDEEQGLIGYGVSLAVGALRQADGALQTIGRLAVLGMHAFRFLVADLVQLRHPWRETLNQIAFLIRVTALPALLMSIPFGVILSVQVNSLIKQVGAVSMTGAVGGQGVMQQAAPIVTALLLGGAAGSAVATDLGARSIREEIDALLVMGVNPVRRLVAPRLAAVLFVAPLLCVFVIFMGLAASYVIAVGKQGGTPGGYIASFASFARIEDMAVAIVKSLLFGVTAILIACQRGLEAKGGARAVADAANAAVVLGVASIIVMNAVLTELTTIILPTRIG
ncbi:MAG: MlaE family ABC transporter permease [Segniliparus sp.]|uniref:MlaE family ABC transporter permease n=1 Tax=Segniliparus sp. TaxID=2804064 RepID=UPI003F38FB77